MGRLDDKVCLITGSSSGIGADLARCYAAEGATLVVTYNGNEEGGRAVAAEVGAELCLFLDVTDRECVRSVMAAVAERHGRIDVLVNNAGINITGDFDEITEKQWDAVLDCDLKGVFVCLQEALPHLADGASVINVGSLSGDYGGPRTPSYAAAKAGVRSLTHCFARFVADRGIRCNTLSPGVIDSDLTTESMPAFLKEKILPLILVERLGRYDELREPAVFLASDESTYVTAQTIAVNGGAWVR
jgi:3-oxoacyl-[acyl-carrier protein] reductase